MKLLFIAAIISVVSGAFGYLGIERAAPASPQTTETESALKFPPVNAQPVLIELFTSEGCATCPPADKLLAQLAADDANPNADVITLSLHVDYWDSPVWRDPYSSLAFSKRQDIYSATLRGENYTPQMIVDGQEAFVGSDAGRAQKAIANAAKAPKATIEIAQTAGKIKIKIAAAPAHENATVFLAIAEDNLDASVRGGENSGRKLTHMSVVRELKSLGTLAAGQQSVEMENAFEIKPDWKKKDLKLVVFLQENRSRKIFGAGEIKFAE